ncbi:hypothetical protein PBS_40330 [Paraburkholderia sp. 2C]
MQALRGAPDMFVFRDGDEIVELAKVEHRIGTMERMRIETIKD